MSNYSSTDSLPPQISSSNITHVLPLCFDDIIALHIYASLNTIRTVLVSPLSIFVLYLGFQRWKQQRSLSSAAVLNLSDFVTYNMAVMELIGNFGHTIGTYASYAGLHKMIWTGVLIGGFPWSGQMIFPILACVERYLAVVHPITYVRLRQTRSAVRLRNISTLCVWLMCFASVGATLTIMVYFPQYSLIPSACQMAFFLIALIFCSLSVMCVLIRPRPGAEGGDRVRVDQSKQRAFRTIAVVMGVLCLRFGGSLVCNVMISLPMLSDSVQCVMRSCTGWFSLPSSLVLPLLFLHREGKLPGCKRNAEHTHQMREHA